MKIGDMVLNDLGYTAILLTEPRLVKDPAQERSTYYIADVLLTEFGCKDVWITDDVEVISENR